MKRWALPVAVAALLALGGLVALEAIRPATGPTQAEQERQIGSQLRCPDCQALSVDESQTAAAAAIRRQITEQLAAGRTPEQIRAYFVARYGDWILLAPSSPLVWLLPAAALLLGVGVLTWWLRRRAAATPAARPIPSSQARDQVREEVEQLDA